ncbi:GA-binding protein subunit beta-2-like protein [Dinothrombium tinctorium]|uniref:GA-binding protein subunit beta-2-like protein n=1 Tax=Dinothrombium tinctorium TaxID=1965070 RepID=A0A3S4QY69_9ACAR|nr:GA-binding protein subunit beta-2-like protein [Dinothrombium tinctorium]RWS09181.1 GA-binding protein subunit beta-2-like protein [Dinothrombium tinctorium]
MDVCRTVAETVKIMKVSTPLSLHSGHYTITGNQLATGQHIVQVSSNTGGQNVNLVDLGKKLLDACKNGETEEVRNLMQSGAPFTTDWLGTSPLHFAAQYGHSETAELLLRAGVSRDTRTKVDRTPLHAAAQEGHLVIVNLLLMHGADVDAKDILKMTPLHWAVERGHTDVVECLLSNGADVNIMSKFDKTPVDIAYDTGRLDLVPLLQKYANISRPKPEIKQTTTTNSKVRPTVLPNKANRTTKITKSPIQTPSQQNNVTKQIFVPSSLTNTQKTINLDNFKKLLNSSTTANNDSNTVLARLAALAESSSTSSNTSNTAAIATEALQWLESHGLGTSSSGPEDTLFHSALETGQTVSLTEAGKLALNWVKEQNQSTTTSHSSTNKNSKVITIVADSTQLPQIINSTQATPIVLVSSSSNIQDSSDGNAKNSKQIKVTRPITISSTSKTVQNQIKPKDSQESLIEKLVKELESVKKQLDDCQQQLREKDKEIERYRQQVDNAKIKHE